MTNKVTNKELIDACNRIHTCDGCQFDNICGIFYKKYHTPPYLENEYNEGRFYTDEVIE